MFRRTFTKLAAAALIHPALNWTEGLTVEKLRRTRSFPVTSAFLVVYGENIAELAHRTPCFVPPPLNVPRGTCL